MGWKACKGASYAIVLLSQFLGKIPGIAKESHNVGDTSCSHYQQIL